MTASFNQGVFMWPECVNKLTPSGVNAQAVPRERMAGVFRECGWPEMPGELPVRMVAVLGSCPTNMYLECPNLPEWHASNAKQVGDRYWGEIGRYYWYDFDLVDRDGKVMKFRMVYNCGDADTNDGLWGEVWDRDTGERVADISSVGDCETGIAVVSEAHEKGFAPHPLPDQPAGDDDEDDFGDDEDDFGDAAQEGGFVYTSGSQFERLIGVAVRWAEYHH